MDPVDFVVTWVDESDPTWQLERREYLGEKTTRENVARYRDWGTLRYWFRAIEEYAPWVNKVHFVTYGHLPAWLNADHPKLNIVKHADYLPDKYLPTFSSHPIELNLHRIEGLSEHFVYFNDDTFLNAPVKPADFFRNGQPVGRLIFSAVTPSDDVISSITFNCVKVINRHFNKRDLTKNHLAKLLYLPYGAEVIKNITMAPFRMFTGFQTDHLPTPFTKSLFEEVWEEEGVLLDEVSCHRFRDAGDVNPWLFSYWNLARGNIHPCSSKHGKCFFGVNETLLKAIGAGKYKMICCNDSETIIDFDVQKQLLQDAFQKKLPKKSRYEI